MFLLALRVENFSYSWIYTVLYSYIGFPCIRGPAPTRDSASDDYVVLFKKREYLLILRCFSLLLVCCFFVMAGNGERRFTAGFEKTGAKFAKFQRCR